MNYPATLSLALLGLGGALLLAQQKQKPTVPDQTNVLDCVRGLSGCDISLLTPDQIKQVAAASRKRNIDYCMEGTTLCDPTRLSIAEMKAVQTARYRRNLEKCLGVAHVRSAFSGQQRRGFRAQRSHPAKLRQMHDWLAYMRSTSTHTGAEQVC